MAHPDSAPAAPTRAPVLVMPLPALVRFRRLMRAEGWEVDLQRMCVDDAYAFDCLATGHCSTDDQLRRAAVGLFASYHRNTDRNTPPPSVH